MSPRPPGTSTPLSEGGTGSDFLLFRPLPSVFRFSIAVLVSGRIQSYLKQRSPTAWVRPSYPVSGGRRKWGTKEARGQGRASVGSSRQALQVREGSPAPGLGALSLVTLALLYSPGPQLCRLIPWPTPGHGSPQLPLLGSRSRAARTLPSRAPGQGRVKGKRHHGGAKGRPLPAPAIPHPHPHPHGPHSHPGQWGQQGGALALNRAGNPRKPGTCPSGTAPRSGGQREACVCPS